MSDAGFLSPQTASSGSLTFLLYKILPLLGKAMWWLLFIQCFKARLEYKYQDQIYSQWDSPVHSYKWSLGARLLLVYLLIAHQNWNLTLLGAASYCNVRHDIKYYYYKVTISLCISSGISVNWASFRCSQKLPILTHIQRIRFPVMGFFIELNFFPKIRSRKIMVENFRNIL